MGIGPPVVALYRQMTDLGLFKDVKSVVELGSQNVWCPHSNMVTDLYAAHGVEPPTAQVLHDFANWVGSGRTLYENLGMTYDCIDSDAKFGAKVLDINFDDVPDDMLGKYDFVTNHGTTEHVINQLNGFKMIHDLAKPGGMMLHALPFLGQVDHGFFNYQPNLFEALAKYNGYQSLGVWIGVAWDLSSFIPWQPHLLDHLNLTAKSTGLLIVLHRKVHDTAFQVPFQGVYETTKVDEVSHQYAYVVDGELYNGNREVFVKKDQIVAEYVEQQVQARIAGTASPPAAPVVHTAAPDPNDMVGHIHGRVLLTEVANRIKRRLKLS